MAQKNGIERSLGRIEGQLNSLVQYVKEINDANNKHFESLDKKINNLETFRDNLQGRMSVIGTIAGIIGGAITLIFNYFTGGRK